MSRKNGVVKLTLSIRHPDDDGIAVVSSNVKILDIITLRAGFDDAILHDAVQMLMGQIDTSLRAGVWHNE